MPRAAPFLLLSAAVLGMSTPASSQPRMPRGYEVVASQNLYSGVDYVKVINPNGPVVAHVAHVSPGAPVDLRVINANDKISTNSRELETTSSMCGRSRCIVGVDGDFHTSGEPVGGVVSDGRMLRSPNPARPQLTVTGDGHLHAGPLPWSAAVILSDGDRLTVSAINATPGPDRLVLYTPAYGGRTDPSARVELVVKAADPGALNRTTSLELRSIRAGGGPIPADGAVLSGDGPAGQQLLAMWARMQQKTRPIRAELRVESPLDAKVSIGADPVVLRDGKRALPWNDPNLANYRQPHTLVGWNKAGDTFLVAVDGRQTASAGLNLAQAADFLVGLGVTDAVNLDGGGGTVFTAGGAVWNRPSDNQPSNPAQYLERGAVNAFVVMARPGAPLPAPSPPPPPPVSAVRSGPGPGTVPHSGTAPGPSGPSTSAPSQFGGLPMVGVGGQTSTGDLPMATAAVQTGGAPAQGGQLTPDGHPPEPVAQGESKSGGPTDSSRSDHEEEPAIIRATLSAASAVIGDVVAPMNAPPWRPRSLGDIALAGVAALLVVRWRRGRLRRPA